MIRPSILVVSISEKLSILLHLDCFSLVFDWSRFIWSKFESCFGVRNQNHKFVTSCKKIFEMSRIETQLQFGFVTPEQFYPGTVLGQGISLSVSLGCSFSVDC